MPNRFSRGKNASPAIKSLESKEKENEKAFVHLRSLFGITWADYFILLGARQAGKSYAVAKLLLNKKKKLGSKLRCYWMRLSDTSAKKLLQSDASKLFDADLVRKFHLRLTVKGNDVFSINEKGEKALLVTVISIATFYNDKGSAYFDKDFDGEYLIVCDEMNREKSERNTFDIVYNFKNQLENIIRNTGSEYSKAHAKVILIGNTLSEASDMMLAFEFLPNPGQFGRYKLRSKRCVIDYLPLTEEYKKMRRGATVDILKSSDDSTFTNEIEADRSLIYDKPVTKPTAIIKFSNSKNTWFTVYEGGVIKPYNKETIKNHIAMRKFINEEMYIKEQAENVRMLYDSRSFRFDNYYTMACFKKELRLLKGSAY